MTHPPGGCVTGRADRENEQLCNGSLRRAGYSYRLCDCLMVTQTFTFRSAKGERGTYIGVGFVSIKAKVKVIQAMQNFQFSYW